MTEQGLDTPMDAGLNPACLTSAEMGGALLWRDGSRRMWRDTAPGIRAGENPANMAGMVSAGSIPAPAGCSIGHPPFSTERARPHQPMAWRRTPLPGSRVPGGWKMGRLPGGAAPAALADERRGKKARGRNPPVPIFNCRSGRSDRLPPALAQNCGGRAADGRMLSAPTGGGA